MHVCKESACNQVQAKMADIEPMPQSMDMWEQSHPPPASQQTDWPRNQKSERGSMTGFADNMVTKMLVCEEKLSIKSRQMATIQPTM
jgi:hypothetical protein